MGSNICRKAKLKQRKFQASENLNDISNERIREEMTFFFSHPKCLNLKHNDLVDYRHPQGTVCNTWHRIGSSHPWVADTTMVKTNRMQSNINLTTKSEIDSCVQATVAR